MFLHALDKTKMEAEDENINIQQNLDLSLDEVSLFYKHGSHIIYKM